MNAEIIKAMNKKEKKHPIRKWWNKNNYKVMRVIFFPIWATIVIKNKLKQWLDSRETWSEERANEILNYYIPRKAKWNNEDKTFYLFDNGYGWSLSYAKKYLKRKDRRFWEVWNGWSGGEIRLYLINNFELEGFSKEVGNCANSWTEITFRMK